MTIEERVKALETHAKAADTCMLHINATHLSIFYRLLDVLIDKKVVAAQEMADAFDNAADDILSGGHQFGAAAAEQIVSYLERYHGAERVRAN